MVLAKELKNSINKKIIVPTNDYNSSSKSTIPQALANTIDYTHLGARIVHRGITLAASRSQL